MLLAARPIVLESCPLISTEQPLVPGRVETRVLLILALLFVVTERVEMSRDATELLGLELEKALPGVAPPEASAH